jgi:hypothetical protein
MCRVREKRIPRRGSSEPSGRSSDRPEGAAPGLLHPLNIGLTTLTVSCDDEDAVWPPEPREEGRSGNRRPSFKQAFSVLQRPSAENIGYSFVRLRATSHNLSQYPLRSGGFPANNSYIHVLSYPDPRGRPGGAPGPRMCPRGRYRPPTSLERPVSSTGSDAVALQSP